MRANLDLRYYEAFPPVVSAGGAIPHDHVPYQGCGSPEDLCTSSAAPSDVERLVENFRGVALSGFGEAVTPNPWVEFWTSKTGLALRTVTAVAGAAHGYGRNRDSVGWALWWGFCGAFFTIPTAAVMTVETVKTGYAKPKRGA